MTATQPRLLLFFLGALCIFAAASPPPPRENIPVNSEVFMQPEYIEALDKELEREDPIYGGSWWIHYQQEQRKNSGAANAGKYGQSNWQHGNLDHIGGGNLLRRNLDPLGGGNFVRGNLDPIGGSNLLRRNLDPIGGGNLLRRNLDQIGGGNLVKRYLDQVQRAEANSLYRDLDTLDTLDTVDKIDGGGGILRRSPDEEPKTPVPKTERASRPYRTRVSGTLDHIGAGNFIG